MKRPISAILTAVVLLPFLLTAGTSASRRALIRDAAMDRVDRNGEYLFYRDVAPLTAMLANAPDLVVDLLRMNNAGPEEQATAREAVRILVKVCNLQAVKVRAESSIEYAPSRYRMKNFLYLGNAMKEPGIFSIVGPENRPLNWKQLPADTILACSTNVDGTGLYSQLTAEFKASSDPRIREIPAMLQKLKEEQGVDVAQLLQSLRGRISLCIAGDDPSTLSLQLTLPDRDGAISGSLKAVLPPPEGSDRVRLPLPMPPDLAAVQPVLVYGKGEIKLLSSEKLLDPPERKLGDHPVFRNFTLPESGCNCLVVRLDQRMLDTLLILMPPRLRPLGEKYLSPFCLAAVGTIESDGYLETICSDFSVPDAVLLAPVAFSAAAMLPALDRSREKARSISCTSNLKMFGLAFAQYGLEHDKYPEDPYVLIRDQYLDDVKFFNCPSADRKASVKDGKITGSSYIYVGGGLSTSAPVAMPVLFDAPGNHNGKVNVLFVDGHVSTFDVPDYTDPSQVLDVLCKKNYYAPEQMRHLRKAFRNIR